jgi:methionyl aminopeptidase
VRLPIRTQETVVLKSPEEIEKMRVSNIIVAEILQKLKELSQPGATTLYLDRYCEEEVKKKKVIAAFKGYRGFPYSLCASVNEAVVHGIPSQRELKEGDILGLDFGILCDGYYGDSAVTIPIGKITENASRLIEVTRQSLFKAIDECVVGNRVLDISYSVQKNAESNGYTVVRDFVGHGIERNLHEPPQVPNYGTPGMGMRLQEGMVLAIEPMINEGTSNVRVLDDGWTAVTADGLLSAHFEHSVAVTKNGPYVLSQL